MSVAAETSTHRGALAWMARNSVAANLFMFLLIVGGILMAPRIRQEVFPEFTLDIVTVSVAYPGASPAEVEQGVVLAIEEAVRSVDGVKRVRSTASEGVASVTIELILSADPETALNDVQSAVNRITSFPGDIERPIVSLLANRQETVQLILYGDADEAELRALANDVRDDLLLDPDVSYVELGGVRPLEISIEVPGEKLRQYGLTLDQVAQRIAAASIELPAGSVKTEGGEILVRTTERRNTGDEFGDITILSRPDGTRIALRDLADVRDGFRETDESAWYNGQRAVQVRVFRVGDETPISVSDAVYGYMERAAGRLPAGVSFAIVNDSSEIFRDRIDLLLRNAYAGLILVLISLGLFLEIRLAFWVTLGIPISVFGAMFFFPALDVSINMISLFAFILTLGIVVDDAIVVGEAVYAKRQEGMGPMDAAIAGVQSVAMPVVFSVLTTVVAFLPILFVPGVFGKFMGVVPIIVITILLISLFESLFILPAHLGHTSADKMGGLLGFVSRGQQAFSDVFVRFSRGPFLVSIRPFLRFRYATLAAGIGLLILAFATVSSGRLRFTFMPKVEGDFVHANVTLPIGAPVADTRAVVERLIAEADGILGEKGGAEQVGRGILALVGRSAATSTNAMGGGGGSGAHVGQVSVFLVGMDRRDFTASEFARTWRERVGEIPGVDSMTFIFDTGPSAGSPIDVQLSHTNMSVLESAAERVAAAVARYPGVADVEDGFTPGKQQLDFRLRPEAEALGLTERELARQLRAAFWGAEAVRQQRGRDEVRVFVRRPLDERQSEWDIESTILRTPQGGELTLRQAAEVTRGRAYTSIRREDGRRIVNVTADVDQTVTTANEVNAAIRRDVIPSLLVDVPGLSATFAGEQKEQAEVMRNLASSMVVALLAMFGLMAIPLRSYTQPLVIMSAIPFGVVGAFAGHMLLGYNLSLLSMFGIVALMGVAVNDSLVLLDAVNTYRAEGATVPEAVELAISRRLRPVLLTSITTFLGLAPMIFETSMQARFLIPMALSLGFGVVFSTGVTLAIVPVLFLIEDDVRSVQAKIANWVGDAPGTGPTTEVDAPDA